MTDKALLPFHAWKDVQVKKDGTEHGVIRYYRERGWYFKAYSAYCQRIRNALPKYTPHKLTESK